MWNWQTGSDRMFIHLWNKNLLRSLTVEGSIFTVLIIKANSMIETLREMNIPEYSIHIINHLEATFLNILVFKKQSLGFIGLS